MQTSSTLGGTHNGTGRPTIRWIRGLTDADIKAEMRALKRAAFDPFDTTDARFVYAAYSHELHARWVRDHAPHLLRKGKVS